MNATRSVRVWWWWFPGSFLCSPKFLGVFVWGFSSCPLRGFTGPQNSSQGCVRILVSVKVCGSCNLAQNSASGALSWAGMQTSRFFCINMQIPQRNGRLSQSPLSCCWGSGGWKNPSFVLARQQGPGLFQSAFVWVYVKLSMCHSFCFSCQRLPSSLLILPRTLTALEGVTCTSG